MPQTYSVHNVDTLIFFPYAVPSPKMEIEYYLWQSVSNLLAILRKPKTQITFLTYGDTTTRAVESIDKLLQCVILCAPPAIPAPNPTPTLEQTIPVPKQLPINVPTINPTMPTVPVRFHRVTIVSPTRPPIQVQRVPFKSPERATIPARKDMHLWPVFSILNTWRHEPRLWHTRAAAAAQPVTQEHLNHPYHPVTGQHE